MKKNVMMRLACFLLVAVLISTSAISGTYAKYTTQDAGNDEARVAKWGISLQVVGDLFGVSYEDGIVASAMDDNDTIRVQAADWNSAGPSNVVAPGTENAEGMSFGLTGTPEVDYQIHAEVVSQNIFLAAGHYALMIPVEAGKITAENFDTFAAELYTYDGTQYDKAAATFAPGVTYYTCEEAFELTDKYFPVVFTMNSPEASDKKVTGTDYNSDSLEAIAETIANALAGGATYTPTHPGFATVTSRELDSVIYHTNTPIENNVKLSNMNITWAWEFERTANVPMYDAADTVLGNLIADRGGVDGLEGEVVKTTNGGDTYVALEEHMDYCLDTQFSIDITVTQVD